MYQTLRRGSAILCILAGLLLARWQEHRNDVRTCTAFDADGLEVTTTTAENAACAAMWARLDTLRTRDPGGDITIR